MSKMKTTPIFLLSTTLVLLLAACGSPSTSITPPETTTPVTSTDPAVVTASLTVTVTGVASAPVTVTNAASEVKFSGTVAGSKSLPGLALGIYTVTAGAVSDYAAPASTSADLSKGNGSATLNYTSLPGQGLSSSQITGTLPGWTFGAANVYFERGTQPTVKGEVDASGAVRLPIPAAIDSKALSSFLGDCTFNGVASNLNVQAGAYSDFRTYAQSGDLLGVVQEQLISNGHDVWHIYSAEDASFDGALRCGDTVTTVKLDLKKGWNYAEYTPVPSGQTSGAVLTTLAADARTQVAFISAKPGVYVALDNPSLDISAGAQLTRKVTVYQTGNYSGTVQLSTTVPGLSVEPKTLTLAPLGTLTLKPSGSVHLDRVVAQQGLTRQSIATTLTFSAAADAQVHVADVKDALVTSDTAGVTVGSTPLKVNLNAPTVTGSASDSGLSRGQTTSVNVSLFAQNQYTGAVQVSLEDLPTGFTASTGQTNFTATSSYQSVTLNVTTPSNAAVGSVKATLAVNAGGRITRTPVTLTVQQPAVQISFGGSDSLHQGESKLVGVSVSSVNGFSGTTTLGLSGLPAGVTAAPLTVSVTPGTSTSANFTLVSTTDAALGRATLTVTDTDQASTQYPASFQLSVRPQLVALLSSAGQIASAHDGVWVLSTATYNSSTNNYQQTLTRYTKAGSAVTVSINPASYSYNNGGLVSTPGGDAVVVSDTTITRYQDNGAVKTTVTTSQNSYNPYTNSRPVADNQGRLWSIGFSPNGGGSTLFSTDLSTGQRTAVLNIGSSNSYGLFRDTAGTALYLSGLTSGILTKIDFSTLARTDIATPGIFQVQALAVAQDGTVWGAGSNSFFSSPLFRLNSDGTVSTFSTSAGKLAFDTVSASTLWGSGSASGGVTKFDTSSGNGTTIVDSSAQDIVANASGGLWLETSEGNAYGLSLIK